MHRRAARGRQKHTHTRRNSQLNNTDGPAAPASKKAKQLSNTRACRSNKATGMDGYTLLERIGSGAFSTVYRAVEKRGGAPVAIKELTGSTTWAEAQALPEVVAARTLPSHEGLLRLRALHRVGGRVFLVMDLCEGSLLDALARRGGGGGLPEPQVRYVMRRLLAALAALHGAGAMHRDVKPENVLLLAGAGAGGGRPVLADFGQLRAVGGGGGGGGALTPYVSTRWYRAPEVLLRAPAYGPAVDVWAAGAVMAELLAGRPVFPGASEADQVFRLCAALGPPPAAEWPEAASLAAAAGVPLRGDVAPRGVAALLPFGTSPAATAAVAALLTWSPLRRPSAAAALSGLAFFSAVGAPEAPLAPAAGGGAGAAAGGGGGGGGGGDSARARADATARQAALEAELSREGKEAEAEEEGKEGAARPRPPAGGARGGAAGGSSDEEEGAAAAPARALPSTRLQGAAGGAGVAAAVLAPPAALGSARLSQAGVGAPFAPPAAAAARSSKEADSDSGGSVGGGGSGSSSGSGSDSEEGGSGYMPSFGSGGGGRGREVDL
jgi:protein kinase